MVCPVCSNFAHRAHCVLLGSASAALLTARRSIFSLLRWPFLPASLAFLPVSLAFSPCFAGFTSRAASPAHYSVPCGTIISFVVSNPRLRASAMIISRVSWGRVLVRLKIHR